MNWVLIIIIALYPLSGKEQSSQQVGPYASSADCERAGSVAQAASKQVQYTFCVPRPMTYKDGNPSGELPKEFD